MKLILNEEQKDVYLLLNQFEENGTLILRNNFKIISKK